MSKDITGFIPWLRQWFDDIYQSKLVSGTNIKSINNQSLLGSGNISINGGTIDNNVTQNSPNPVKSSGIYTALQNKQDGLWESVGETDNFGMAIFNDDGETFYSTNDRIYHDYTVTNKLYFLRSDDSEICFDDLITLSDLTWNNITGKPSTYTPATHSHSISEVTNLSQTLNEKANKNELIDTIYPVGSIYITIRQGNPATWFGAGTWVQLTDAFLYASNTADTNATTAPAGQGEATHTLTEDEMPSHNHTQEQHRHSEYWLGRTGSGSGSGVSNTTNSSTTTRYTSYEAPAINNTGGGQAHNNMPPYIKVYMWKRTA